MKELSYAYYEKDNSLLFSFIYFVTYFGSAHPAGP